ncbi:hypothetical protein [Vannielia litorea]|uniref:Integron gene cassette protein n=1 Tax=Vannielia litorea TaxID=1217970 RepID=A0A1N6IC12_9RHOB|nr:hypothetical protein [Vannielia litorea]SIO29532.1 hypothetical protein SAMN05444002_3677 [Vannielia litorea]
MRKLVWLIAILAVAALAAAFTKPGEADVEAELKALFLQRLASTNPSAQENGGAFALTLMCKADHDACYEIVRAGLDVSYEDRTLYSVVGVEGFGDSIRCYGVFTRFFCNGEIPVQQG